jgi:hypothetical protein
MTNDDLSACLMTIDPSRLRFGPYTPPAVKKGDRTSCLYRDADVVVTAWTAARIPWPRCRALASRGGAGLLVTDELRRAILSESAAAVMHWFGVSTKAVWKWRRAFGVAGRLGTPGSRELNAELCRAKGTLGRATTRTPQARRKKRRLAIRLNLARHLIVARASRWDGRGWTAEQLSALGTRPDADLAERFGRTEHAVRQKRTGLGIPTFEDRRLRK